jgi:mono/diheme cytochrome c family protein
VGNVNITPLTDMVVANLSATGVAADVKASDVHSYSDQRISTATQSVKSHLETQGVHTASLPDDVIGTKLSATHGASKGDSHDSVLDDIKAKLDAKHKTLGEVENELNSGHETRGLSTSTGQPGDAAAGKLAYEATCQSCHGAAIHDAVNASKILKAIQENEGGMGSLHIDTITADNIATYLAHGGSSSGTTTPPTTALTTQTITFASPGAQTLGATAPILSANASSGLMVTLTSVTSTVCSVNASTLTLMTAGNCTLKASQAGDSSYAAANTVVVTFSVTDPNVTVTTPPTTGLTAVAATGKVLYANCSGCHGAAAANGSLVLNGANSAATIQAAINSNVGGMRRLSSLTAQNLADIAAYLATPNI